MELGSFLDVSMQFEEDLAIMHRGKLEAIAFCFPSELDAKIA